MLTKEHRDFSKLKNSLLTAKEKVYDICGFELTDLVIEKESKTYEACVFTLNGLNVLFRKAKITPTKTGQFVTLWKRVKDGPIQPFEISDDIDLFVISVVKDDLFGQFIFPKSVLAKHGIISNEQKEGKRGIRVYPPWDTTTSKQAQKTQEWQTAYFLPIDNVRINLTQVKKLYYQSLEKID